MPRPASNSSTSEMPPSEARSSSKSSSYSSESTSLISSNGDSRSSSAVKEPSLLPSSPRSPAVTPGLVLAAGDTGLLDAAVMGAPNRVVWNSASFIFRATVLLCTDCLAAAFSSAACRSAASRFRRKAASFGVSADPPAAGDVRGCRCRGTLRSAGAAPPPALPPPASAAGARAPPPLLPRAPLLAPEPPPPRPPPVPGGWRPAGVAHWPRVRTYSFMKL
mmetsp:Transcript_119313/g.266500  ORF Transcript_119313/g.266500 Transcript_119313/m.266500 type:complete len:220 (+) Transcript_119313:514-1173(+)